MRDDPAGMGITAILTRFARQKRGAIAVLTALTLPVFIAGLAFAVDFSIWCLQSTRLQSAADAAALGAGYLLEDPSLKLQSASAQQSYFLNAAQVELDGASNNEAMIGNLSKPISVSVAGSFQSVTVTLTSQASLFFAGALGVGAPTLKATATASLMQANDCAVALDPSASGAISATNNSKINAQGCSVFANSNSGTAIIVAGSGNITASTVGTEGGASVSNGGSVSPTVTTHQSAPSSENPYKSDQTPSAPSGCSNPPNYSSWQSTPYQVHPFNICGTVQIGGNGSSDVLYPGVYYVTNGSVIFDNANVSLAAPSSGSPSGVTFVLTGTNPGDFEWRNNSSGTLTAYTSGATAGVLVWQACPSSGATTTGVKINNGSTFQASGAFYTPCGSANFINGTSTAPTGQGLSVIADTINLGTGGGGATLNLGSSNSGGGYTLRLTQ